VVVVPDIICASQLEARATREKTTKVGGIVDLPMMYLELSSLLEETTWKIVRRAE
jgi:hypothetical protein